MSEFLQARYDGPVLRVEVLSAIFAANVEVAMEVMQKSGLDVELAGMSCRVIRNNFLARP